MEDSAVVEEVFIMEDSAVVEEDVVDSISEVTSSNRNHVVKH